MTRPGIGLLPIAPLNPRCYNHIQYYLPDPSESMARAGAHPVTCPTISPTGYPDRTLTFVKARRELNWAAKSGPSFRLILRADRHCVHEWDFHDRTHRELDVAAWP
jgi:hypothetical protein